MRTGRLRRLTQLGGAVAGAAGSLTLARQHRKAAERLVAALGDLKGLPMKLGQMISYVDDALPEDQREVWREVMGRLQAHTPSFPPEVILEVLQEELGDLDAHFAHFEQEPLAAASIGQVHGATLLDGTDVVVKVQYPGVKEAFAADLDNIEVVVRGLGTVLRSSAVVHQMEGVFHRLLEETDYLTEAQNQRDFVEAWAGDPGVLVPRVIDPLCSSRVLVMERVHGLEWPEFLASAEPERRRAAGRTLFRFVFTSLYGRGWFNADPHPGNYLFLEDGRVAFIDYGSVERYPPEIVAGLVRLRELAIEGELAGPEMRRALDAVFGLPPDLHDDAWTILEDFAALALEPLSAPQPFRFDRAYTSRLTRRAMEAKLELTKGILRHGFPVPSNEGIVFIGRVSFGLANLLASLEAEEDWPAVLGSD